MAINNIGTVGIIESEIDNMKAALKVYKEGIDEPLAQLSSMVDYAQAFKGSNIADSVKGYLEKAIAEIKKMTDYLLEFDTALDTVRANYEAEASAVSQKVGGDTDSVTTTQINTKTGVNPFGG
jgi:hypothetical protein